MAKLDMRKDLKALYAPSAKEPAIVDVPELTFLMIDGTGDPNTAASYQAAVQVLYSLSYGLKFEVKRAQGVDYAVMALEGLWWAEDMSAFSQSKKDDWLWTAMIAQPSYVTSEAIETQRGAVLKKNPGLPVSKVRFEAFREGLSAQIMHIGPYAAERPTIERLHHFIQDSGYERIGKHHEIYLSDPGRTAPDKLKTVVRQPMAKPSHA